MSLKQQLLRFIETDLARDVSGLTETDSLLDLGLVDSIGLMKIMVFVEQQTGLPIPDREVTPDNFQSVADIERLVESLRSTPARA
jgi:acyl carrier protein